MRQRLALRSRQADRLDQSLRASQNLRLLQRPRWVRDLGFPDPPETSCVQSPAFGQEDREIVRLPNGLADLDINHRGCPATLAPIAHSAWCSFHAHTRPI